jgi:hypothetical protein
MADGQPVHPGAAACPFWLELGTVIEINGIGQVACEDRYPRQMGDHLDVWEPTPAACQAITSVRAWQRVG